MLTESELRERFAQIAEAVRASADNNKNAAAGKGPASMTPEQADALMLQAVLGLGLDFFLTLHSVEKSLAHLSKLEDCIDERGLFVRNSIE